MKNLLTCLALLLLSFISKANNKADSIPIGNNPGFYSQYNADSMYSLMWKAGCRTHRSTVAYNLYETFGASTFLAQFQFAYNKGMRNNVFFLDVAEAPYTNRDTSHLSNGAQTWMPKGLYLNPFNVDSTINTNNKWAMYVSDIVTPYQSLFTTWEVWNEPDLNNTSDSYLDSTQDATSWEKVEPNPINLTNMNASVEDYVQLCKVAYQVIKHINSNLKVATGGIGNAWFYRWFLIKGGGPYIDVLAMHSYPEYAWTAYPNIVRRNSDYAAMRTDSERVAMLLSETQTSTAHKPFLWTETNITRWSFPGNASSAAFPNNKLWGDDAVQRNYCMKVALLQYKAGALGFHFFSTGEAADSADQSNTNFAMGEYKNLNKAGVVGHEVLTQFGQGIVAIYNVLKNYTISTTQLTEPANVHIVTVDSSGKKSYVAWAITTGDTTELASAPWTMPAGVYNRSDWNSSSLGTATGTVTLTANPQFFILQTSAVNQPPVANAGADQVITLPLDSVTLNGTASHDPDGTISTYAWSQISGPSSSTIRTPAGSTTIATNLVQGVYQFKLVVTDNLGATGTDTIKVTVNPVPNQPPVANAGSNQTITLPTNSTSLNGSASSDPDGTIAAYLWTQTAGPNTSTITNATTATPTVSGLIAGQYTYQLKVTDNQGATATSTVKVTVNPAPNQPPVANAGSNQNITLPTNSTSLNGSTSHDPDGTIAAYLWTQVSGPNTATITGAATATPTVSALIAGTYTFQLQVTDNQGATGTATVKVTVTPQANTAPTANAGADKTITLPLDSVTLDGTASHDPDGTIVAYAWVKIAGPSTFLIRNASGATTVVTNLVAGTYSFQLTVTDNSAATGKDTVNITVNPAPNVPPIANAGANQTITLPLDSVTLNGSASTDPDGTISAYSWTKVAGPGTYTLRTPTTANTIATNLVAGTYSFRLLVTDNNAATNADTVNVIVNPVPNVPPTANAGPSQTITLPVNSTSLNGSASSDPDGTIASYAWVEISGPSSATITSANTATPLISKLVEGKYTFQLTVTDNNGATGTAQVKITVDDSIVLPITISTFTGSSNNISNTLVATFQGQIGVDYAILQRSDNGVTYDSIGVFSNVSPGAHSFIDNSPMANNYYRVALVSNGGIIGYSPVVFLTDVIGPATNLSILSEFPNPFTYFITVTYKITGNLKVIFNITDVTGRTLRQHIVYAHTGVNKVTLNGLNSLAHGIYILVVNAGQGTVNYKLMH